MQPVLLQWPLLVRAVVFVVLLGKTERSRPLCCQSVADAGLVIGPRSLLGFYCLLESRWLLAQFELKGGDLHGIQADGGVVGQRRAGVHQSERHGLEQLQVQVLEQSRYT